MHTMTLFRMALFCIIVLIISIFLFLFIGYPKKYAKTYGITWSTTYARYLGIDPVVGLRHAVQELGVRHVRLPAYWTEIEPKEGKFDWRTFDQLLNILQEVDGKAIVVVGAKQPRWPECWYPEWVKIKNSNEREKKQLAYVEAVVRRYKDHPAVAVWQVENEPGFFSNFGDCRLFDPQIMSKETQLIQRLDRLANGVPRHPFVTTASGELSSWTNPDSSFTGLGVSVYRVVANRFIDRWSYWFLPPWFYDRKSHFFSLGRQGKIYVSEFQMEPWVTTDITQMPIENQFKTFDLKQMKKNHLFAERINMPAVYFWGTEWWYWMKITHHRPEFWNEATSWFTGRIDDH